MRTPNTECIICGKALYRRPFELARIRYAACLPHREQAKVAAGVTDAQQRALAFGRRPGRGNGREGYKHRPESRAKCSASNKAFHVANPEVAKVRAEKFRGPAHYLWDNGATALNQAIRRLADYRRWAKAVRSRDGACLRCGASFPLDAHHVRPLAHILREFGILSTDDARRCAALWDIELGETLCRRCHFKEHGRQYNGD